MHRIPELLPLPTPARAPSRGALALLMLSAALGCSTAAEHTTGGSSDTDGLPPYITDGKFMTCQHKTTNQSHVICIDDESVPSGISCTDGPQGFRDTYVAAVCAHTFGGSPNDYDVSFVKVSDYPQAGYPETMDCAVDDDYSTLSETPSVDNVDFFPFGSYNECSEDSYCLAASALNTLYGTEVDPYRCNDGTLGAYRCVGSRGAACGLVLKNGVPEVRCPLDTKTEEEYCVLGSDPADAAAECAALCMADHEKLWGGGNPNYPSQFWMDCDEFYPNAMLFIYNTSQYCPNKQPIDPAALAQAEFLVSLVTDEGGSTVSTGNDAYLAYVVDNCTPTACDIEISSVLIPYKDYTGTFHDASGAPYSWQVAGVSLDLLAPVRGTVDFRGTVTFPAASFELWLATGAVQFGGMPFDSIAGLNLSVDQVVGSYQNGVLTLNITYNTIDANVSISLTTR